MNYNNHIDCKVDKLDANNVIVVEIQQNSESGQRQPTIIAPVDKVWIVKVASDR